jgi:hypothetical protein
MMTETEGLNPFDDFEGGADIMAYIHRQYGDEGLRDLLAEIEADRESLERDAAELQAIGLPEVAAIVAEIAANTPEPTCPFPEGTANARDWLRRHSNAGGSVPEADRWWLDS